MTAVSEERKEVMKKASKEFKADKGEIGEDLAKPNEANCRKPTSDLHEARRGDYTAQSSTSKTNGKSRSHFPFIIHSKLSVTDFWKTFHCSVRISPR